MIRFRRVRVARLAPARFVAFALLLSAAAHGVRGQQRRPARSDRDAARNAGQSATPSAAEAAKRTTAQNAAAPLLTIEGEVSRPLALTAADLARLPRRTVRATDHGTAAEFAGVRLDDVLRLAGVEFGERLRGKRLELFLVVEARDGYRAVFALPELDTAFTDRVILLADARDGKPLDEQEGALRVVVPDERRGARWVRQVARLVIRRA